MVTFTFPTKLQAPAINHWLFGFGGNGSGSGVTRVDSVEGRRWQFDGWQEGMPVDKARGYDSEFRTTIAAHGDQ